ncbi:uncharacterized protein FA14DRAFT_182962 [Meira miltonrushii]|uniref:Uncharacterized protein n=1 Tax=Meira miltonrushii TaxID=1280837 RepID=A0A316V1N6_9BASI|nr:uncharacterized protein FA14DRAFT_182962 [Meira miltonrushii]PWN31174.1 hypothetical protein FA14DRAFT_182962 [Meira miltonrushii]
MTHDDSVSQHKDQATSSDSSSDASSASSGTVSRSRSTSSRRNPRHTSSRGKRAITPYQPPNPNDQSPMPDPNQQTPVNQAIRIREPVDRPPELPRTHPIQHNEPPPRYERPSMIQRLRANEREQLETTKDKGKKKVKENAPSSSRKRKHSSTNDNEAGPSGTKPSEEKKQRGFWTKIAIVNGVRKGCNAACRAGRNQANRLRERITGIPSSGLTRKAFRHEMNLSNRRNFEIKNRQLLQIQRERNRQQLIQNRVSHQPSHSTARIRPRVRWGR